MQTQQSTNHNILHNQQHNQIEETSSYQQVNSHHRLHQHKPYEQHHNNYLYYDQQFNKDYSENGQSQIGEVIQQQRQTFNRSKQNQLKTIIGKQHYHINKFTLNMFIKTVQQYNKQMGVTYQAKCVSVFEGKQWQKIIKIYQQRSSQQQTNININLLSQQQNNININQLSTLQDNIKINDNQQINTPHLLNNLSLNKQTNQQQKTTQSIHKINLSLQQERLNQLQQLYQSQYDQSYLYY